MKSQGRKKRGRKKDRGLRQHVLVSFLVMLLCCFFCVQGVGASPSVINKDARERKNLFDDKKLKDTGSKTGTQSQDEYVYDPTGKLDPFKSFIAEQEDIEEKKSKKPKTHLETLALSQLDLIAIIVSSKAKWAMVRDAKGLGYVIKKGTPIGRNDGIVYRISQKEVIIREKTKNIDGEVEIKDVSKKLLLSE